ncbi:MAG: 50S ribosomal protein L25 [Actinomycetota bacterium]|jgi:large subunit ribosomal protein L25|nr:50S ribosomal protein L25 [Acidimicrobiales bacterium]MED5229588.1 50S ribosomal protein L25 [Actinomycetota bacterium]MED5445159.1 50S ribosomal protein L25 [Actinomycetota bacterium]|tara:strand:+ start:69 stop:737 length:669 start_codon:yes stop_codon:yes gene_type:complete
MADLVLNTEEKTTIGSRSSRRLRRDGKVPGVLYGLGQDPEIFSVDYGELRGALTTDAGLNALIQLSINGTNQLTILKTLQRHPVKDEVIHVDFVRVDPKQELAVEVPIVLEGVAKKVTDQNGMVDQTMFSLSVLSLPDAIPNELTADVSELEINDAIRVSDVVLPEGVRTEVDPEEAIAVGTVTRSTMESIAAEEASELEADEEMEGETSEETDEASTEDSE